jgi:hypothetical protein
VFCYREFGATRGVLSVYFDKLAQVLDSEVGKGRRVFVTEPMDADEAVLGFHLIADLMKPVFVFAEKLGNAGEREHVGDGGHLQAA